MYQDLIQELRINSLKFTDHNGRKRNMHPKDETGIILRLEKDGTYTPYVNSKESLHLDSVSQN